MSVGIASHKLTPGPETIRRLTVTQLELVTMDSRIAVTPLQAIENASLGSGGGNTDQKRALAAAGFEDHLECSDPL
jgi:hypothetical protein